MLIPFCINGIPELIESGKNGILVHASDTVSLQQALTDLASSPQQRLQLGRAARQTVVEKFDRDKNFAQLATLFKQRLAELA